MTTTLQQFAIEAKRMQRLQDRRRRLRKELRDVEQEMKLSRKNLRALSVALGKPVEDDLDGQLPPDLKGKVE